MPRQIIDAQETSVRRHVVVDGLGDLATIKPVSTAFDDASIRIRESWVRKHLPGAGRSPPGQEDVRESRILAQQRPIAGPVTRDDLGDREAPLRVSDGRRQQLSHR